MAGVKGGRGVGVEGWQGSGSRRRMAGVGVGEGWQGSGTRRRVAGEWD